MVAEARGKIALGFFFLLAGAYRAEWRFRSCRIARSETEPGPRSVPRTRCPNRRSTRVSSEDLYEVVVRNELASADALVV